MLGKNKKIIHAKRLWPHLGDATIKLFICLWPYSFCFAAQFPWIRSLCDYKTGWLEHKSKFRLLVNNQSPFSSLWKNWNEVKMLKSCKKEISSEWFGGARQNSIKNWLIRISIRIFQNRISSDSFQPKRVAVFDLTFGSFNSFLFSQISWDVVYGHTMRQTQQLLSNHKSWAT